MIAPPPSNVNSPSAVTRLLQIADVLPAGATLNINADGLRSIAALGDAGEVRPDLTAAQAAELWGRRPSTVRSWAAAGRLPGAYRLHGREWRIPATAIAALQQREARHSTSSAGGIPSPSRPAPGHDLRAWRREVS